MIIYIYRKIDMEKKEQEQLTLIFSGYIENCLNQSEDQEEIEEVEELFRKVCNLLDIYDV